tara:strand:+ start:340 stop:705 length:366 start_codon:yes stop_codon:yes gene_type:complete
MAKALVLALILIPTASYADAKLFAEIQLGWKNAPTTSSVLRDGCNKAYVPAFGNRGWSSCGGRNPTFNSRIGWEFNGSRFKAMHNVMIGWHHFSHVRDGSRNDRPETHFDEIFISKKWGGF